ncbi:beta strand repeat-containing protein [Luteolibacter soli]|uniref:Autotransporter-associated beta strand repeat-containing protein n=1 Tax=Luteolibacter soli TaxID=3135280 RepID=A0ABU9AZ47_9BACT
MSYPTQYPSSSSSRRLALQLAALATFATIAPAFAATSIYTPASGTADLWSAGTHWDVAPASAATTRLTFVGDNTTVLGNSLVNANTDDVSGEFLLNILDLQGTGPATGGGTITVNAGGSATGLTLATDVATPIVNLNALSGGSSLTYQVNPILTLASDATFTGAGTAAFKFSGGVNGAGRTLTKTGASQMSIGGSTSLESLLVGFNNGSAGSGGAGGKITGEAGSFLSVGTGTGAVRIGSINSSVLGPTAVGAVDLSAASSFNANVTEFFVGVNYGGSASSGDGTLNLSASNTITATTTFAVGRSAGNFNTPIATATIPANSTTAINTPLMHIGQGKANASFTVGNGSTFDLAGVSGGRAEFWVGHNDQTGSGAWSSTADFGSGTFHGYLTAMSIGRKAANSSGNATGAVTFGNSDQNDFNLSASGSPLVVGRYDAGTTGVGTGTLTIGHLGFSSSITSTNNSAAILIGTSVGSAITAQRAVGTLNLGPGSLTLNTTGAGISGDLSPNPLNSSTVKFNGTTLISGASSAGFIQNLTNARISDGGLTIATGNNSNITVPQGLTHDPAGAATDGGLTKDYPGILTLTSTNSYTGNTKVLGGTIFFSKTASLPGFATPGRLSVGEFGGLGMNVGGAGEFTLAQLETYRTNGTFLGTYHPLILDTANAGADQTYTSSLTQMGAFAKRGANKLTLGNDVDLKGSLDVGLNNSGGTLVIGAGKDFSLSLSDLNGLGAVNLGVCTGATNSLGTFDASAADSFAMEVSTLRLGTTIGAGTAGGNLSLPANSSILAHTDIVIADSNNTFNNVNSTITTGAGGTATVRTPVLQVGHGKGRGFLTAGAGSTIDLAGPDGGRTAMQVGNTPVAGGSGSWSGTANFAPGTFTGALSSLIVGDINASSASTSVFGTLTLGTSSSNHLDIEGAGTPVVISRYAGNTSGQAYGFVTIGNAGSSTITSTDNGTAVLMASGGASGTTKASACLNLGGGTLTITTTGRGIAGDTANAANLSILSFDGTTMKAGADSGQWIESLSRAEIRSGGVTIDTNGHGITSGQPLVHSTNGTLAVTLTNGGTGYTTAPTVTVVGGGGFGANAVATISGGAVTGVTLGGVQNYNSAPTLVFSGGGGTGAAATVAHTATEPAVDGGLTKRGAGTLFLDATHSYTGSTTILEGELMLGAASLPDGSGVSIAAGATLNLVHGATDTVAALTLGGVPASIGVWGSVGSGAPNTSPRITGTGRLNVLTGPGGADPYDTWASQIANPADRDRADDPDGDGFTNDLEYLFGTSPITGDGALVHSTVVGSNLIVRWNQLESGGVYQLQESTTMVNPWTVSGVVPAVAGDQSGVPSSYDRMEATVPIAGPRKFVRVSAVED